MPRALTEAFNKVVHAEYPGDQAWSAGWQYDSAYDIYIQARQHRGSRPAPTDRPYIVSEYGDWEYFAQDAGFHQDSWSQMKPEARNSRQGLGSGEAGLLQQVANVAEAHDDDLSTPAFADGYWVMFDYNRGLRDPGQPASLQTSGVMSLERAPKFAWWFFRSQRDPDDTAVPGIGGPMAFIASWWLPGSSPRVHVYSNAEEVELLINGKSLGRHKPLRDAAASRLPHPPFVFDTGGFTPGTLEARAYIGDKLVASDRVTTPGAPAGLKVWIDDAGVPATVGDLVFARAQVVDAKGVPSRADGTPVVFTCPDQACEIVGAQASTEGGLASALVRVRDPKRLRVVAKSPGLAD
jgi:beta-galactosidase